MAVIRHISIENFRSIRQAEWYPGPGFNCLIGPGILGNPRFLMLLTWCWGPDVPVHLAMLISI